MWSLVRAVASEPPELASRFRSFLLLRLPQLNSASGCPMSALPPKADIDRPDWNVRFVPEVDISTSPAVSAECVIYLAASPYVDEAMTTVAAAVSITNAIVTPTSHGLER